jgi:hypothetical protein
LKIMTSRTAPATTVIPLWTSVESAVRLTVGALSPSPASASAFEEIEGEQARIRRTSRHWLLG